MNGPGASYQLFVADSGTHWLGPCYLSTDAPADLRVEQARDRILDDFVLPFVGTGVDALVFRVDAGNQFLCYDTEAGEPVSGIQPRLEREYGLVPRAAGGGEYVSFHHALGWWRLAENFKLFEAHGFDPWSAIIEAAHLKGFQVFLELQINPSDAAIHHLDGSGLPASRFLLEHPEYLLGYECHRTDLNPGAEAYRPVYQAPAPDGDTHSKPETAFCARLDFGRDEVRRYRLAVVEELCARYELDGLQINLCADPHFFKRGEVDAGRELMTRFVADMKAATRRIGAGRGRPIRLLFRFFAHRGLEALRDQVGLDVARWIREGSADLVAPVGSSTANEHVAGGGRMRAGRPGHRLPGAGLHERDHERPVHPDTSQYRDAAGGQPALPAGGGIRPPCLVAPGAGGRARLPAAAEFRLARRSEVSRGQRPLR